MKKLLPILLLVLLLYSFWGSLIMFKAVQYSIKKEVKERIANGDLDLYTEVIRFSKKDLGQVNWEDEGEEFWYNGNIFDITRTVVAGDSVYFYCIRDTDEKNLFSILEDMTEDETDSGQEKGSSAKKIELEYYYTSMRFPFASADLQAITAYPYSKLQKGFFTDIHQPPEQT